MGEGDLADGQVRLDQQEHRDARPHRPLRQQRGALEIQPVPRRSAQHRDRGQGRVQRGHQRIFLSRQPVGQQQAEQVTGRIGDEIARHLAQLRHPVGHRQRGQVRQDQRCGTKMTRGKPDRDNAVAGIALRPDLSGRRTSGDHAVRRQMRRQPGLQHGQIVGLRAEQQDQRGIGAAQAVQQGRDHVGPAAVGLHSDRPGCALHRSRVGVHQPASNNRIELASSTACVRRRALILDMIAVMWVLTVASAIDSS